MLHRSLPRLAWLLAALLALAACTGADDASSTADPSSDDAGVAAPTVALNVDDGAAEVPVDTELELTVADGTLADVEISFEREGESATVPGTLSEDDTVWTADHLLEPSTTYAVTAVARNEGEQTEFGASFTSTAVPDAQRVYPSVAPLDGETVGVGMPIAVYFSEPVAEDRRAEVERRLLVHTDEEIEGTWAWLSDTEVRYRPEEYWPSGTDVTLDARLGGVDLGNGFYGQTNREIDFSIGARVVSTVDIAGHTMTVNIDGEDERTIPVTSGRAGFESRVGTKVLMEKHDTYRLDSSTTGPGGDDYLIDVQWAMRLTPSGEFIHSAPWSTGSQGNANVSHGCVGMSIADAGWLYERSLRGDLVVFENGSRPLERHNGWTDWDLSYEEFSEGSALES